MFRLDSNFFIDAHLCKVCLCNTYEVVNWTVKGCVSRDFRPTFFFMIGTKSRPLINRLKYFRIRFRFRQDIQILKKLRSVHPTTESDSAVFIAVCITPRSHENKASEKTLRCASHGGVGLCGVHHTHSWARQKLSPLSLLSILLSINGPLLS